jgi:hypothetical protein
MSDGASDSASIRVGLISDTHGKLDARVLKALDGVDHIVHAGDVGHPSVIWELELLAPVTAVAGNVDWYGTLSEELPAVARLTLGEVSVSVVHVRSELPPQDARSSGVVVFGHSHMPLVESIDGVLWVNPGSASQARRSQMGRSVGLLEIDGNGSLHAKILPLSDYGEQQ